MDPEDIHVSDQIDGYSDSRARRFARFYTTVRAEGVPTPIAAVLVVLESLGWHFHDPPDE